MSFSTSPRPILIDTASLLTKHTPTNSWLPVIRPYTPISTQSDTGHITLLVKQYPNGKGSSHLHSLQPGDSLAVKPIQELDYKPNQYNQINIVAGGAGITPFVQLIRTVFADPKDETSVSLVYANNTDKDVLLKDEFDSLTQQFPNRFRAKYIVSEAHGNSATQSAVEKGHVTTTILAQAFKPTGTTDKPTKTLICGPPPMMAAVCGAKGGFGWTQGSLGGMLKELGYSKDQVQKF